MGFAGRTGLDPSLHLLNHASLFIIVKMEARHAFLT
jgi:hypothetical protein